MSVPFEQILKILKMMQTPQVRQAQQILQGWLLQPQDLKIVIQHFFTILQNQSTVEQDRVELANFKTLSIACINKAICEKLLQIQDGEVYASQLLHHLLLNPNVQNADKRLLERSIVATLEFSGQRTIKQWLTMLNNLLKNSLLNPAYLVIGCFCIADLSPQYFFTIVQNTFEPTLNIALDIQNANQINELLKAWELACKKLAEESEDSDDCRMIMQQIANSSTLGKIIQWVLEFQVKGHEDLLLCVAAGFDQVNVLKGSAAECNYFNILVLFTILSFGKKFSCATSLFELTQNIIVKTIKTLAVMAANPAKIQSDQANNFLVLLLKILRIYCLRQAQLSVKKQNYDHQSLIEFWVNVCNMVIYPFLQANQSERQLFQENFLQFNSLTEDCCDKQESGTLKTQAAKLLQTLGNKMEGCVEYTFIRAVQSLKQHIGIDYNKKIIPEATYNKPLHQAMKYSRNNPQPILPFQTALLSFCLFAYFLNGYPQILKQLRSIVSKLQISKLNYFQLGRFFQFLAYTFPEIYNKKQQENGQNIILFAVNYNNHETVRLCALDFICNAAEDFYSDKFFKLISDKILAQRTNVIWGIVSKTINNKHPFINENAYCYLVNQIFKRIKLDSEKIETQKNTLPIVNCLHILRKIVQNNKIHQLVILKQLIWEVLGFFETALILNIQDEMALIFNQYLKQLSKVTDQRYFQALEILKKGYIHSQYTSQAYLYLLNNYILKCDSVVALAIYSLLKEGLVIHMKSFLQKSTKVKDKTLLAHHLLLVQNLIAMHGIDFPNQSIIEDMQSMASSILSTQIENKVSNKIIFARAINIAFLCYMHKKSELILKKIHELIFEKSFMMGYDSKMLIQCIGKQIQRQNNVDLITAFLKMTIRIAKQSKQNTEKQKKKRAKAVKQGKSRLKADKIQMYESILKTISTPFQTKEDQNALIKHIIVKMKNSNQKAFAQLMRNIQQQNKKYLSDLLIQQAKISGKTRKIFKVSGVKSAVQQQQQQIDQEKQDDQFKRTRLKVKRKKRQ